MSLREALDRTLRLMRQEVTETADDDCLLQALTGTTVVLIADLENITSHAAQTAFITAAILMVRSGHQVFVHAPDVPLMGAQLPLMPGTLIEQLLVIGRDLLPGIEIKASTPPPDVDVAIAFGSTRLTVSARRRIRLNATAWTGQMLPEDAARIWQEPHWPLGAMAAAGLVAVEVFKEAMQKLSSHARVPLRFTELFAPTSELAFHLAKPETPRVANLGKFDCISGGAIANALLYALARIPGVTGEGRVIEPESSEISNLNRYMLLLLSHIGRLKASDVAEFFQGKLNIEPIPKRYDQASAPSLQPLAKTILVGADNIPTRWDAQKAHPAWLGIGATADWAVMSSFHNEHTGCAQCLHQRDDADNGVIPTIAFVSFWAGLLLATYLLKHLAGAEIPQNEQNVFMAALHAERPAWRPTPVWADCPTCHPCS